MACGSGCGCGAGPMGLGGQTITNSCAPSCDNAPPVRDWHLADKIAASELTPGGGANVNLTGIPAFDSIGRKAMITGIRFRGEYAFTIAGATNDAITGYQVASLWNAIFLEDHTGWQYLAGCDGRDLLDDRYLRTSLSNGSKPEPLGQDVGAGTTLVGMDLYFPITRPGVTGPEAILDAIPLASVQARGDSAYRFTSPVAFPAGSPAGVALGGFSGLTEVWVEIAYIADPVVDRPWQVETYETNDTSGQARHADRTHEYVCVRHYPDDSGGAYIDDYGAATFQVNGQTIASSLTLAQWAYRTESKLIQGGTGLAAGDSDPTMSSNGNNRFGLIVGPAPHSRAGMAAGRVQFNFASRTRAKTRFLHRSIACQTVERAVKIAGVVNCAADSQCIGLDSGGLCAPSPQTALVVTNRNTLAKVTR